MVTSFLLIIHIVIVAIMIGLILLQKNEGGGLGIGGGGGFMTARGTANLLTHATAFFGAAFFVTTLCLAIFFKGSDKHKSILDKAVPTQSQPATPPATGAKPALPTKQ
jgi:preprotein translocase subunit SecG